MKDTSAAMMIQQALKFIDEQKAELERQMTELNYIEDVNGNLIFEPWHYKEEKEELSQQLEIFNHIIYLLTVDKN